MNPLVQARDAALPLYVACQAMDDRLPQAVSQLLQEEEIFTKQCLETLLLERRRLLETSLSRVYRGFEVATTNQVVNSVSVSSEDTRFKDESKIHGSQSQNQEECERHAPEQCVEVTASTDQLERDKSKGSAFERVLQLDASSESKSSLSSRSSKHLVLEFDHRVSSTIVKFTAYIFQRNPRKLAKYVETRRLPQKLRTFCENMVQNKWFEFTITLAILLSAVSTGFATEHYLSSAIDSWKQLGPNEKPGAVVYEQPAWMKACELAFAGLFLIELMIRITATELMFICGSGVKWNILDALIVISAWVDILVSMGTGSSQTLTSIRVIRVLRVMRSLRIVRVLHMFRELRVVLLSLLGCVIPLFWAMLCIFVLLFVFVVFFMQGVGEFVARQPGGSDWVTSYVLEGFADFGKTLLSCLKMISGGKEWAGYYDLMHRISSLHSVVLVFYIILMTFGALNVVTGIFVENATTKARLDFEVAKSEATAKGQRTTRRLAKLFRRLDKNMSGTVSLGQWQEFTANEDVQACFSMLDIDISKTEEVFRLLDLDGSGELDLDEFITGCLQIQGSATHVDVECLARFVRSLMIRTLKEMHSVKESIREDIARHDKMLDRILSLHTKGTQDSRGIVVC